MEVIYQTLNGIYPFQSHFTQQEAFVDHLLIVKQEFQYQHIKLFVKKIQAINCMRLIPLIKVLKEDYQVHFLYRYVHRSLLTSLKLQKIPKNISILSQIQCAIKCLTKSCIKSTLKLNNIGIDNNNILKFFISPLSVFQQNVEILNKHYENQINNIKTQLNSLEISYNQELQRIRPKQIQNQNFIINGNVLIFLNQDYINKQQKQQIKENEGIKRYQSLQNKKNNINQNYKLAKKILNQYQQTKQLTLKYKQNKSKSKLQSQKIIIKLSQQIPSLQKKQNKSLDQDKIQHQLLTVQKDINLKPLTKSLSAMSKRSFNQKSSKQSKSFGDLAQVQENIKMKNSYQTLISTQVQQLKIKDEKKTYTNKQKQMKTENKIKQNKITMKIVTCQQIQFYGNKNENIEQLAQQKLLQYKNNRAISQSYVNKNEGKNDSEIKSSSISQNNKKTTVKQTQNMKERIEKIKQKANILIKNHIKKYK